MAKRTVLLVIDMQVWFRDMTEICLPNILKLNDFFDEKEWWQIFTQHGHTPEELTIPSKNQLVNRWGINGSIHKGSPEWELMPEIGQAKKKAKGSQAEKTIFKNTYDAFINTDMAEKLKAIEAERVVVCGVMTNFCCDTSARSAFNRGFETWLVDDACGSANREQHQAGLKGFGLGFGDVLTTKEVMKRLNAESA